MMVMPSQLIVPVVAAVPVAVSGLAFGWSRSAEQKRWLLGAVIYCLVYNFVLGAPHLTGVRIGHWNWLGKIGGVAVSLACWRVAGLTREKVGWRLPRGRKHWMAAILGAVTLGGLAAAERLTDMEVRRFGTETLVFQTIIPGLDEELACRGVLLAMLLRAFPGRTGAVLAAGLVTVAFWLVHVVQVDDRTISVPSLRLDTLIAAIGFVWIRRRTNSVLASMAAHDLDNLINTFVGGVWI